MKIDLPFFKKRGETLSSLPEIEPLKISDIISPSSIEVRTRNIQIEERFAKTFFIFSYPRYLSTGWFSPIINLRLPMDISFFVHPVESSEVLKQLRRAVTHTQAEIIDKEEKGIVRDPVLETAYQDLEELRDRLQTAQERMFKFGLYLTIYDENEEDLDKIETTLRSVLEGRLIYIKPANYRQRDGFISTAPYGMDLLQIHTSMPTYPLSSTFPFVSFDLSSNEGILYGLNQHNSSLILFDRFTLENANSILFGVSGSGKSYAVKLEILRSLMLGVDVIIVDPENEYRHLCEAVDGEFFGVSLSSPNHINPFDLPQPREDEDPEDVLRASIINLVGLIRIMFGGLSPEEDSIMDLAITETYAAKDITPETDPAKWRDNLPLMEDLETVLQGIEGADTLLQKIQKFTKGSYAQFFNQHTNISMGKPFISFGIRDMEEELRPMAMFLIMRHVWNSIRSELKKRIFVVDEAWWLMRHEDGASFLFGLCKRARKYWLGVTTITQDVNDFMKSSYGAPIVTNSSLQLLMKQSPATIGTVQSVFNLTEEEKIRLLEAAVGEGLFFAGTRHAAIKVVASFAEDQIITTSPEQLLKIKKAREQMM